ncbi:MAG: hypothetical protein H0X66_01030 [Verrucomicrobia bacterium]|nr:hypothetical protein [Verrucomicrobiota bacterium]
MGLKILQKSSEPKNTCFTGSFGREYCLAHHWLSGARQENKTRGLEFQVSTLGFKNVVLIWDQHNSATASKYWRVQYSTDGINFADYNVITSISSRWFTEAIDFSNVPGVDDNPNFKVRLISEFESTATGAGADAYVGVGADYGTGGTLRLDMVYLYAESISGGQNPVLDVIHSGNSIQISWPANAADYVLEASESLSSPNWLVVGEPVSTVGDRKSVTISNTGVTQFFHLKQ